MFDENNFRYILRKKGITLKDVARDLGISLVTLYRKMNGESDFSRLEIQKIGKIIGSENIIPIFFTEIVT